MPVQQSATASVAQFESLMLSLSLVAGAVVGLVTLAGLALWLIKIRQRKRRALETTFLLVTVPAQNEIGIEAAEQMFASLAGIKGGGLATPPPHLSFEIVAKQDQIAFYVVCPNHLVDLVTKQINGAYPDAEVDTAEPWDIWEEGSQVVFGDLKLKNQAYYPIKVYEDLATDPLSALTSAMSNLGEREGAALQIVLLPAGSGWAKAGKKFVDSVRQCNADPEKKKLNFSEEFLQAIEKKIGKVGFEVCLRIVSTAPDKQVAQSTLNNLAAAFEQFADPTFNRFKFSRPKAFKRSFITQFIYHLLPVFNIDIPHFHWPTFKKTSILNAAELATIYHFPNQNVTTPHIVWLQARSSAAPSNLPKEGLYLGKSTFRGVETPIYMLPDDRLRHHYIIGQTGTGKSKSLMQVMAYQDIQNGEGLAFIDPHGEAVEDLLKTIPEERLDDVIYFNAGDLDYPVGLNIMDVQTEEQKHLVINSFIALLYKLYDPNRQGMVGAKLERAVRNVMLTAMSEEGNTMIEVLRMLIDEKFAESKLPLIKDPMVKRYWTDELAKTSDFHKSETLGYFVSKFDRFVTEAVMRNIVGQPKTAFDLRDVMDNKKILLINLAKGRIGEENSNFLGLLIVPRILAAALGRADTPEEQRQPFYLYVDEFQNFATPDFATILSEARKYRLALIVANQFIGQLPEDIKGAIFGNVGTRSFFRIGIDDADYLEPQVEPHFTKQDLANNPVGRCYTSLLINGHPTAPFSMETDYQMYLDLPRSEETAQKLIQLSRERYARPRAEVEADIRRRVGD